MSPLLAAVANLDNLYRAWSDVRAQVRHTAWPHLLDELAQIETAPLRTLRLLHRQLTDGSYRFSPKWAYAKRKSGGSRRGITVQGLPDRIVQRAILQVIYASDPQLHRHLGELPTILQTSTSFAGTPGRGVPEAVAFAYAAIRGPAKAFAYSDMKDFFPYVPRQQVVALLQAQVDDQAFLQLFAAALETEIRNPTDVAAWLALFPTLEVGVAQGSLLSTLVGNLSLREFDVRMNCDGLTTVRYLDDFLILATDLESAAAGFGRAQQELGRLGMSCYAPQDGSQKAALGWVRDGFNFLGCHLHPDGISPARSSGRKLVADITRLISQGKKNIAALQSPQERRRTETTYVQTLAQIDRKIRGWGDAYQFVSNRLTFSQIDAQIDRLLSQFHDWFRRKYNQVDVRARRRMHGVALLADTPKSGPGKPRGGRATSERSAFPAE